VNQVIWNVEGVSDAKMAAEGAEPLILEFIHTRCVCLGFGFILFQPSRLPIRLIRCKYHLRILPFVRAKEFSWNRMFLVVRGIINLNGAMGRQDQLTNGFPAASGNCLLTVTDTCGVADAQAVFDVTVYPGA
jgi:hypothetical protein